MTPVPVFKFGKDHWSMLLYVDTRCVSFNGSLDFAQLRSKTKENWSAEWGTRLAGYFQKGKVNRSYLLADHDDYDCIKDLEVAGYCNNVGTLYFPVMVMTDLGYQVITALKKHKANGGSCANFTI